MDTRLNREAARACLNALEPDGTFVFQTFDDRPTKRGALARIVIGQCDDMVLDNLAVLNENGAGVFVTVNRTDGTGRLIENITAVRALFVDGDDIPMPQVWHQPPSMVVRRDERHWHAYWLLDKPLDASGPRSAGAQAAFRDAQKRLAAYYSSDPRICDLPRVMRLPGFMHRKGEPILVELLTTEIWRRYEFPAVLVGIPELPVDTPAKPVSAAPGVRSDHDRGFVLERAQAFIQRQAPAVSGSGGHSWTFHVAACLVNGFRLSIDEARPLLAGWNMTCQPPWSEKELERKLEQAVKKGGSEKFPLGWLLNSPAPRPVAGGGQNPKGYEGFETEIEIPEEWPADSPAPEAGELSTPSDATPAAPAAKAPVTEGPQSNPDEAREWLQGKFEADLASATALTGVAQDEAVLKLFERIAIGLEGASTITKARIRETVCKALSLTKVDYEQALREERARRRAQAGDSFDWASLARLYLAELGDDSALLRWRERWYWWTRTEGAYTGKSDEWMDAAAARWLATHGVQVTTNAVANFLKNLRGAVFIDDDIKPPCWLSGCDGDRIRAGGLYASMQNGILDLDNPGRPLMPLSAQYFTLCALPYKYDPAAACPMFEEAVLQWQPPVNGDCLGAQLLQDWAAYCLIPGNPEQKFLLNVGDGRDGKSQYSEILTALVGPRNTSTVGLDAFDPRKDFGLEPLLGKSLNITGDANIVEQMGEGALKAIVGGDRISVNRKNKSVLTELLDCKFVINANQLPYFRDRSDGLWRRILLLNWYQVPEEQVVKNFAKKLIEAEMPGIFNWALHALPRVRAHGLNRSGCLAQAVEAAREEIQHEIKFFEEMVDFYPGEYGAGKRAIYTFTSELVAAYREWCVENNVKAVLYEDNLAKSLRKWLKRKLLAGAFQDAGREKLSETAINNMLFGLREREAVGRRRRFYVGVLLAKDETGGLYSNQKVG